MTFQFNHEDEANEAIQKAALLLLEADTFLTRPLSAATRLDLTELCGSIADGRPVLNRLYKSKGEKDHDWLGRETE